MGRRRGFLPPAHCQQCGKPPDLGQSLWPGERWFCITCLEAQIPGKDTISKSMHKTIEYTEEIREAFDREAKGLKAEGPRNQAEWARMMAVEIKEQGMARTKGVAQANGEAVPSPTENFLHDALTIPDLAAVEASVERSRLLLQGGTDVAAMAIDAVNSIGAANSLEKMLAHQMVLAHKIAMEQIGRAHYEPDPATQVRRFNSATRFRTVFQNGLLALHKLRQGGQQNITVQYVSVRDGGQAVIGNVERGGGG